MLLYQVDAFTERPFAGNPAAVALLEAFPADERLQQVAAEMNLSETAFLVARADGGFDLRWFTPTVEVDLCGHATLAGAHVLWEAGSLAPGAEARFHTRSGLLTARRTDGEIWMDFPAEPPEPVQALDGLAEALGQVPSFVGRNRMDVLAELADAAAVRRLRPDLGRLATLSARGVIVTARGEAGCDFVSRFFAPAAGVPEDPVTGSAHCALAPYWHGRLGRARLTGCQVSARGGRVEVEHRGRRVALGGQAVTVGTFALRV